MKNRQSTFSFTATVSSCFNRQIMYIRNNNFFLKYLKYIYIYFLYICNNDTEIMTGDVAQGKGGDRLLVFVNVGMVRKISPSRFSVWKLITICIFDRQSFIMVIFSGHTQAYNLRYFRLFSVTMNVLLFI